jgi:hypothetical protein
MKYGRHKNHSIMKKSYLLTFLMLAISLIFYSCSDNGDNVKPPDNKDSTKVVLKSIKIVNAGADGNTVVEGTIDKDAKTVTFSSLDPETDFSNIKFEAELSSGATLDKSSYSFSFPEGDTTSTITVRVVNEDKTQEYQVTISKKPVKKEEKHGADFDKVDIIDYTDNPKGNDIYEAYPGTNVTRGSAFDGDDILILNRGDVGPHLLKVSDLEDGNVNRIDLNVTGVSGGTYPFNQGALSHGHIYVANLSLGNTLKLYHWSDPADAPEVIKSVTTADIDGIDDSGDRFGDNISLNLDDNGDGYVYFGENLGTQIIRMKVSDFTTISDLTVLPALPGDLHFGLSYDQVGSSDEYLMTGFRGTLYVVDASENIKFKLDEDVIPKRSADARVVSFNNARYLITTTAARSEGEKAIFSVYDITEGNDIISALKNFQNSDNHDPVFTYDMDAPRSVAPIVKTGWTVKGDGANKTLVLFTAATNAGFVLFEVPEVQK